MSLLRKACYVDIEWPGGSEYAFLLGFYSLAGP